MNARDKINQMSILGAFLAAACTGIVFGSWGMFFIALFVIGKILIANRLLRTGSTGSSSYRRTRR